MPRCRDCAEQDGFDGMCLAKGEYKTPNTPACELFFASNAAELKGLRVLNRELRAENAKLRELVQDMYGFIESTDENCGDVTFSDCFDYCKHDSADDGCCKTGECYYERRMRELGIEVKK